MKALLMAALVVALAISGCLSTDDNDETVTPPDVGYDPAAIDITGVRRDAFEVTSFDGTNLATVAYIPLSPTEVDGSAPVFPVIVFMHGWGIFKEQFEGFEAVQEGARPPDESEAPEELMNILSDFAEAGFIAVAYDARGMGQSEGVSTIAGAAELEDLDSVLDYVEAMYDTSGRTGLIGTSYGGGQALLAWAQNDRIDTVVPMFGWYDLFDGLVPGNVPKLEWAEALFAITIAGTQGQAPPMLARWYEQLYTRSDLETVEAEMDVRSVAGDMAAVDKPLFVCHGLQESLFPQGDHMWEEAGGFARAYIYTGGHNVADAGCLERSMEWMHFWLAGYTTTSVPSWPLLETHDASGHRVASFDDIPTTDDMWYLRAPDLSRAPNANVTFTIEQRLLQNPFVLPAVIGDAAGPDAVIPDQFRQDPAATFFAGPVVEEPQVLVGAATMDLRLEDVNQTGWQVVGQLLHIDEAGRSRILSRAAYAALDEGDVNNGTVSMRFHFTKAQIEPGEQVVLKLSANDPSWFMPLMQNYAVTFTGESELHVPYFTN